MRSLWFVDGMPTSPLDKIRLTIHQLRPEGWASFPRLSSVFGSGNTFFYSPMKYRDIMLQAFTAACTKALKEEERA